MNVVGALIRCPLFGDLPMRVLTDLARVVEITRLQPGDLLFAAGDPSDTFYLVVEGGLQLMDRSNVTVGLVGEERWLNETAVLVPSTQNLSAYARRDSAVIGLSRDNLEALWQSVPPAAALAEMAIAKWTMQFLREANDELLEACDGPLDQIAHDGLRELLSSELD